MTLTNLAIPVFFSTIVATVLLILITFSASFSSIFYFLHADTAGGIKFGIWGWCSDSGICSPKQFGYSFPPEIDPIMTKLHIFYPIAAGICVVALLFTPNPIVCRQYRSRAYYPFYFRAFSFLMLFAWMASSIGFWTSVVSWAIVKKQFRREGIASSITDAPLLWMAMVATILMTFIALNTGCRSLCRTRLAGRLVGRLYIF